MRIMHDTHIKQLIQSSIHVKENVMFNYQSEIVIIACVCDIQALFRFKT